MSYISLYHLYVLFAVVVMRPVAVVVTASTVVVVIAEKGCFGLVVRLVVVITVFVVRRDD